MDAIATAKQVRALEQDERLGIVQLYLDKLLPKDWEEKDLAQRRFFFDNDGDGTETRDEVSVMEIWAECFKMSPAAKKRSDSDDIVRILLQLDWKRSKGSRRSKLYGPQVVFRK